MNYSMVFVYAVHYACLNAVIQWMSGSITNKPNLLATNAVSQINAYLFIAYSDVDIFLGYLVYDFINSVSKKDYLMIIHHVISFYLLTVYIDSTLIAITWYFELANIVLHYKKIIQYSNADTELKCAIAILVMLVTIPLWVVFRMIIPLILAMQFQSTLLKISTIGFFIAHAWWIKGMIHVLKKNIKKIRWYARR